MKYTLWVLLAVLIVLHQDYWQWDDSRLLFGFLPYSLAYHMALSIAAAIVWLFAARYCWPLEESPPDESGAAR